MSAWIVTPKPNQTTSLLDIMSEELIHKLNADEGISTDSIIDDNTTTFPAESANVCESDYQEEINHELNHFYDEESIDSDLALAIALQEIEELEHENLLLEQQRKNLNDDYSKINVSFLPGEPVFPARKAANVIDNDDIDSCAITDHRIMNGLRSFEQKRHQKGIVSGGRVSAKDIKITAEGVLDPTTRMILYKLIQNNKIDKLHGVIKTGKEANVYHGYRQPGTRENSNKGHQSAKFHWDDETSDFAVKIFRTTLNEFGNRQDYFHGDHRYQGQKFTKGGTKESIAKWTEKEYRNLTRAYEARLPVPRPIYYKENVLIMSLIDENSSPDSSSASDTTAIPSPQLKELNLSAYSPKLWDNFYLQTLSLLDRLYHDCRLVHGDLSEYNLLLHSPSQTIYMIDFGQSVDTSHPNHRQFLQRDIHTINTFFQRLGVGVKSEGRILENIENGDRQFFHIESEV